MQRSVVVGLFALVGLVGCGKDVARSGSSPSAGNSRESPDKQKAVVTNVGLGRAYLQNGQYKLAMEHLEKALQLDPKSTDAHTVYAILQEKIGQDDEAGAHYKRAVELSPKSGDTNNNYGAYLCRHQRYDEADAAFGRALSDPFYATPGLAWGNRGACAQSWGHLDIAEESFRRALERDPSLPEPLLRLAMILHGKGDAMKARAFLQRYESAAKATAESLALAVKIEQTLGDARAASDYKKRLLSEFPESAEAQKIKEANDTP